MDRLETLLFGTSREKAYGGVIIIRLLVGWVFLFAGLGKFADMGGAVHRFGPEDIGIPAAEFFAPFVASFEVLCGALVLLGLLTRPAAIPLGIIMIVALWTTKVPILWGEQTGLKDALQAARLDISLLLGSIFLLLAGGGRWALDRLIAVRRWGGETSAEVD